MGVVKLSYGEVGRGMKGTVIYSCSNQRGHRLHRGEGRIKGVSR